MQLSDWKQMTITRSLARHREKSEDAALVTLTKETCKVFTNGDAAGLHRDENCEIGTAVC